MSASGKAVCIPCRRVYKGEGRRVMTEGPGFVKRPFFSIAGTPGTGCHQAPLTCPVCKGKTVHVSYEWRPPKRRNDRAWKRIERGDWMTEEDPKDRSRILDYPLGVRRRSKQAQRQFEHGLTVRPRVRRG